MSFVHLHNHSHYSLLDGLNKIDDLVNKAKEQGSPAVAITDHGVLYGAIEFYQKCRKAGIKPIIGVETYLAPGSRHDKKTRADAQNFHLILLAKNNEGYKNLIKLISLAHLEGFYYKPRIDWELLEKYHEGIIASTACLGGEIPFWIQAKKYDKAKERILEYQNLFGKGNFYLELMDHPELEGQSEVNDKLIEFSKELGVPLVATNDAHYLNKEDDEAQDILLCIQNKKKVEDTDRMKMIGYGDYSFRSNDDMIAAFSHIPEAVENTLKIAKMCNVEIELGNIQLPHFEVPEGYDGNSYLKYLCEQGIAKRYGEESPEIRQRLDYELEVIAKMGWPAYFLIVADFVNWSKEQKIIVGPGRGSAAGSIVCYLTGITNLDPLKYDLLFERFLNPERISMPDIDLDFADARRDEVIRYVEDKYGKDHVSQIITFGTMAARAAVRDVGRVLSAPYDFCDRIAKMIPPLNYKLKDALTDIPELKELYETDPEAKRILDYAKTLEGVARHHSMHACGVLITKNPLTDYVPVQYTSSADKNIVSQYSLHPVEDLGLLKMDFLGLKNLTIIESALRIIKNTRGQEIDIDEIPLDDTLAYKLFQDGETTGVFQFESSGMKRYLRELKPTEFEDIIAMVALYRPGPMEWIPDYINSKHGQKINYLHPKLEPILDKTYGVAIYQEQVMQIARDLAGFSMGQADILRKAMGKKIASLLAEQKEKFVAGCLTNGLTKDLAKKIFSFIEPFAGYGFNRSHAACYAMIGYQTAYLKAHYPVEFMAALLTADQGDTDRIAIEIEECRNMGMQIMPPDVNESYATFTVVTEGTKYNKVVDADEKVDTIRFGLKAIKNVGEHIVEVIIADRKKNGPFKDVFDLLDRISDRDLNKKSLESLVKSGALDKFADRGILLGNMEFLLNFSKESARAAASNQASLFGSSPELTLAIRPKLQSAPEINKQEKLAWEKELLGLYISEHPFSAVRPILGDYIVSLASVKEYRNATDIRVSGIISSVKKILTRSGKSMLFVKIEDATASVEVLVFPSILEKRPDLWQESKIILIYGRPSDKDQDVKVLVETAMEISAADPAKSLDNFKKHMMDFQASRPKNYKYKYSKENKANSEKKVEPVIKQSILKLSFSSQPEVEAFNKLKELLAANPGDALVYLEFVNNKLLKTSTRVSWSPDLENSLSEIFSGNVVAQIT